MQDSTEGSGGVSRCVDLVAAPLARVVFDATGGRDPEDCRVMGERWRDEVRAALAAHADLPSWDETLREPAFVEAVPAAALASVRLLALLADRQEAVWPDAAPDDLEALDVWQNARASDFATTLLTQVAVPEIWLPGPAFFATCKTRGPSGDPHLAGSLGGLIEQLGLLDGRTFQRGLDGPVANATDVNTDSFVDCAAGGLSLLAAAARRARAHELPLFVLPQE